MCCGGGKVIYLERRVAAMQSYIVHSTWLETFDDSYTRMVTDTHI